MNRREAVKYVSFLLGGTLVGSRSFLPDVKMKQNMQEGILLLMILHTLMK